MEDVERCKGVNDHEKVILRGVRGSSVSLYGCQVTSWKNELGEELLFLSSKATFNPPKAISGGIPICFPQVCIGFASYLLALGLGLVPCRPRCIPNLKFSNHGPLEPHGFARNRFWSIDNDPPPFPTNSPNKAFVDLILKHSDIDVKIWPHR